MTTSAHRLDPLTLEGEHVRLEPLSPDHVGRFCEIGLDRTLWAWTTVRVSSCSDMKRYIEDALAEWRAGKSLPFATVLRETGEAVGCTRFMAYEPAHRRVEIGSTWVAAPWQRTCVNTESKYLMLEHAFLRLACQRVEFKTDALNERSRRGILRLGATEEGTLRQHMVTAGGRVRDTVYYSILDSEWRDVRGRLREIIRTGSENRLEG
jgi:N-acetyltransferase